MVHQGGRTCRVAQTKRFVADCHSCCAGESWSTSSWPNQVLGDCPLGLFQAGPDLDNETNFMALFTLSKESALTKAENFALTSISWVIRKFLPVSMCSPHYLVFRHSSLTQL